MANVLDDERAAPTQDAPTCEHGRPPDEACGDCLRDLERATAARQADTPAPSASRDNTDMRTRYSAEPERADLAAGLRDNSKLAHALERVAGEDPDQVRERERAEARAELDAHDHAIRTGRWDAYAAGVLGDYQQARYDKLYPQQDPDRKVTGWWRSGARTLLIAGPSSHGKSTAAYAVTNEVALADRDASRGTPRVIVRAWNVTTLRRVLAPPEAHQRDDRTHSAKRDRAYEELLDADLLLLDDLGREHGRDWWGSIVYEVLEHRAQDGGARRTIVTMNAANQKTVGDLIAERYGSPVWTRIRHDAVGAWVQGTEFREWAHSEDLFK